MTIAHHGTRHADLPRHPGLCLTIGGDSYRAASEYARAATDRAADRTVFEVQIDLADLVIEEVEVDPRECWDRNEWPCDRAEDIAAMLARGVDAIRFADATVTGRKHQTIRLLSERALAAIGAVEAYEAE
jgi:hypothetical protein